jgi:hypothetical protein
MQKLDLPSVSEPGMYRIRVAGRLGPGWADRVGDMRIVVHQDETRGTVTDLTGTVADQAALQGLLEHLYARGHVLLFVQRIGASKSVKEDAEVNTGNRDY